MGKRLKTYNSVSPKLYGLPKVHKHDIPMRPIVGYINSPRYYLSKYLRNILSDSFVDNTNYNIKDIDDKIKNITLPDNYIVHFFGCGVLIYHAHSQKDRRAIIKQHCNFTYYVFREKVYISFQRTAMSATITTYTNNCLEALWGYHLTLL